MVANERTEVRLVTEPNRDLVVDLALVHPADALVEWGAAFEHRATLGRDYTVPRLNGDQFLIRFTNLFVAFQGDDREVRITRAIPLFTDVRVESTRFHADLVYEIDRTTARIQDMGRRLSLIEEAVG